MRVGISAEFIGIKQNGVATYAQTLLCGLAASGGAHEFVPYISSAKARSLIPRSPRLRPRMVYPYKSFVRLTLTLPFELVRHPVHLLHAQGWGPLWSPCPMVLTVHDIGWERHPEFYPKARALRLSRQVRASARRAVCIIASSQSTADDLVELYQIPPEKIRVVYPGMSSDIGMVSDASEIERVRGRYGIAGPYILYVGSIEPKKNVDRLIRSFAELRRQRDLPHKLVIGGTPLWLAEPSLRLPASLGLEQEVIFTGALPDADLSPLYSGADVFAFLGSYEGFGYPPLEAMACGAPVLAADRASLPEVVGDAGLLVNPFSLEDVVRGLARLIDDAGLRARLRQAGFDRARRFTAAAHGQEVVKVYEECVRASPGLRRAASQ
jgi:glycosyltransferase involved in cell wall biosynthesis